MFSRYKKDSPAAAVKGASVTALPQKATANAPAPAAAAPAPEVKTSLRRPTSGTPAQAAPVDKEAKRRERIGELKLELHR